MRVDFFVINLDRSPDRLAQIQAKAASLGMTLIRVAAVDGKTVPEAERHLLDRPGFLRQHGKIPQGGEYGCYASHLAVLDRIAEGPADIAVVFEDDAEPPAELPALIDALLERDDWDLVKLAHHRRALGRPLRDLPGGRRLYAALHGPNGSSGAYIVRRHAATRLRTSLTPMRLPFDVALERGWANGIRTLDVWPDPVRFSPLARQSLTVGETGYRRFRLPWYRRLTVLRFRTIDAARRLIWALTA